MHTPKIEFTVDFMNTVDTMSSQNTSLKVVKENLFY